MKRLLDRLMTTYEFSDRNRLEALIRNATVAYRGSLFVARDKKRYPSTLHELAEPLPTIIDILGREGNQPSLVRALVYDGTVDKLVRAENRLNELRKSLVLIQSAVLPPPAKRRQGRPTESNDLLALVSRLADFWMRERGDFTRDWHKETTGKLKGQWMPITPATRFVYDVVRAIDRSRLISVKKAAEKIPTQRRGTTSRKGRTRGQ